jgi:hypothetical protein
VTTTDAPACNRYDRYLSLNLLTNDEGFMWCQREGCSNGQITEGFEKFPLITCSECGYKMCFLHQTAWHEDLTCAQYDSQRKHGDPNHDHTLKWIGENSKPCPGPNCGVRIQKGEYCFHMTCKSC